MARRRNAALPLDSLVLPGTNSDECDGHHYDMMNNQIFGGLLAANFHQDLEQQQPVARSTVERYKLVVVGDEECGKTALLNTLVKSQDYEVEDTFTTFEDCVTDIKTPQEHVEFTLYEVTGMDDYASLRIELYHGADVFLICFDIGRPETLGNVVNKWAPEITDEYPQVPFLVVGCKNDLRTDAALLVPTTSNEYDIPEHTESVPRMKAEMIAQNVGSGGYVECCAKTRWNVDNVFKAAAEAIVTKDEMKDEHNAAATAKYSSVLRRFSRLTTNEKNHSSLKRGSIFSFVVGSNNS